MTIAVLNCGSSSIKYSLYKKEICLLKGIKENIIDYRLALQEIGRILQDHTIVAIGHRVVHGGCYFRKATLIDTDVINKIDECNHLAPLHNPTNLLGILEMQKFFPKIPAIAVFDTSFHQNIPPFAHIYPIPYSYYKEHQIRRYGFHGISHEYLLIEGAKRLNKPKEECSFITAHLGNGASVTAIEKGISQDTSMGFSPLEGLMMGTRSGNIDPSLVAILANIENKSADQIVSILNNKSGLLGISGVSNDMRELHRGGNRSLLAIEMFIDRLVKAISALRSSLKTFDGLIFGGGIGENDPLIREKAIKRLSFLNLNIDVERNKVHGKTTAGLISQHSHPGVWVIHTNDEKMIAKEVLSLLQ